jgi:hypothetical protein
LLESYPYGSGTGSRSYDLADDGTTETAVNHIRGIAPARPGRLRRIRYSFECLGWQAAMTELANGVDSPESDSEFDAQHGTDTAGSVEPGDLGIDNAESRKLAIRYLPSPLRVTSWMLDRIGVDPREYSEAFAGALPVLTIGRDTDGRLCSQFRRLGCATPSHAHLV